MSRCSFYSALLHTAVLTNFALTARLYDLLGREPAFFTVRRAGPWDVAVLVVVLSLAAPGALLLAEVVASRFGERPWRAFHTGIVAVLAVLIALAAVRGWTVLPWPARLLLAAVAGGLATTLYARYSLARTAVTILWPALVIFPGWMLLASPVRAAFTGGFDPPAIEVRVARPAPVVLIIFDEFCGMSLAGPDGELDARRFPGFASLARDATWFRNATTMSPSTHEALPCLLTGRYPKDPSHPPEVYEYPENLFRLLGHSHRPVVFETETRLCPPHLRNWPAPRRGLARQVWGMCRDLAAVELHILLPADSPWRLPSLDGRWGGFFDQDADSAGGHPGCFRRAEQFEEFVSQVVSSPSTPRMEGGEDRERPGLYVAHVMLPHVHYEYLPDGTVYDLPLAQRPSRFCTHGVIGLQRQSEVWVSDETAVAQAAQRYLLQLQFTDRLIARLVERLKQAGRYDETLIVVTADHGVSFRPGQPRREAEGANCPDILSIPLFVKRPHQRQGATSDRNVQSADIVPTIVAVLGVDPPWPLDGVSAVGDSPPPSEKEFSPEEPWADRRRFDAALPEKLETCREMQRLVGRRNDGFDLYAIGPNADMAGRPVEAFALGDAPAVEAELLSDAGARVLCGRVLGRAAPSQPLDVAVAIRGRIAAVARTCDIPDFAGAWTAILPPEFAGASRNDIAVYAVLSEAGRRLLLPMRIAPISTAQEKR